MKSIPYGFLLFLAIITVMPSQALALPKIDPVTGFEVSKTADQTQSLSKAPLFIFGAFSPKDSSNLKGPTGGWISDLARDKFTLAGPWYPRGHDWLNQWLRHQVSDCIRHSIGMIYPLVPRRTVKDEADPKYHGPPGSPISVAKINSHGDDEVTHADAQQMDKWLDDIEFQIKAALSDPAKNSVIAGWYIMPEEMRHWRPKELELLRRMHETVRKFDPEQRPALMYEPQHSSETRLAATLPYQDILTVGIYPHHSGNTYNRVQVRHTMTQMMNAIASTQSNALPVPTLEMFENNRRPFNNADIAMIPTFVRHDVYCAFANGAKGILVWSMGRRTGFNNYSKYYKAWADVSNELHDFGLREVFIHGQPLAMVTARVTSGQKTIRFKWNKIDEVYPSISIRDWSHENKNYILIVNSALDPIEFFLDGHQEGQYKDLFSKRIFNVNKSEPITLSPLGTMMLVR